MGISRYGDRGGMLPAAARVSDNSRAAAGALFFLA